MLAEISSMLIIRSEGGQVHMYEHCPTVKTVPLYALMPLKPRNPKMIELDVAQLSTQDAYKLMIGAIVPRPIGWISTASANGRHNLAPFSFFTGVCSNPPSLLFCPVDHPDGREKDTLRNIRVTGDFVVNIATESLASQVNQTSADFAPEISEFQMAGLTPLASVKVSAPRVGESPVQFECRLLQIVRVGPGGRGSGHIVIGEIVFMHVAEDVYRDGRILLDRLQPLARLDGKAYCPVREVFELTLP